MSDPYNHFDFNFKKCAILDQNAVSMLGGLARYVDEHNSALGLKEAFVGKCGVMFLVDTMSSIISKLLIENNFLKHFSNADFSGYPEGDYIGYREHTKYLDSNEVANHLHNEWLTDSKLSMSSDLKQAVISRIFEIFMNAYGHAIDKSNIKVGAISCGQHDKKSGLLRLAVLDFCSGIISNVRECQKNIQSDIAAMKWALITGNSTRTDSAADIPRGLGFGLLNEFVAVNKGRLSIFSNSCSAIVGENGAYIVQECKYPFKGTMVNITINCDNRHYKFLSETSKEDQYF
jgi:hypothetical protein